MDIDKVIEYLKTDSALSKQILLKNIECELGIGNLVIELLIKAENGDFHEMKKPEMVCLCLTKYSYYSNNYDNCTIEELIGCNNCQWYVPKNILELFEKFEKDGFPTDEELDILLN